MHSSLRRLVLLFTLILVLAGCPLITGPPNEKEALATAEGTGESNDSVDQDTGVDEEITELPPSDVVRDAFRVSSSDFKFETLLPVELDLTVRSNAKNEEGFYPPLSDIVVTLMDKEGTILFRGLTDADGLLGSTIMMPSAPNDVILEFANAGRTSKSIEIPDAVERSTIDRIIYLDSESNGELGASTTAPDADGDGVVDAYDAFPNDPDRAFAYDSSLLTVAFEDLYLQASAGDADYNDFLAQYQITVETNAEGLVTGLTGVAYAKKKLAGYNHDFGIFIEFNGTGDLSYSQINSSGSTIREVSAERVENGQAYILLFESTKDSIDHSASFDLDFDTPIAPDQLDRIPFDPFLYVRNTRYDIHLIGEDPLPSPYSQRIGTGDFQDADGFPWALLVPGDWINPGEGVRIETVYPAFDYWRSSFGEDYPDWYEYYQVDPGPPSTGEPPASDPLPPYPVVAPNEDSSVRRVEVYVYDTVVQYQLQIALDEAGRADPNGDQVFFRSNENVGFIILDESTGLLTLDPAGSGNFLYSFWSEDETGLDTSDNALQIIFRFGGTT